MTVMEWNSDMTVDAAAWTGRRHWWNWYAGAGLEWTGRPYCELAVVRRTENDDLGAMLPCYGFQLGIDWQRDVYGIRFYWGRHRWDFPSLNRRLYATPPASEGA